MKKIFLLSVLFLAACGQRSSDNSGGGSVIETDLHCGNLKEQVLALSGAATQDFVSSYAKILVNRNTLCTLDQVTQYLDKNLTIECKDDCVVSER